MKYLLSLIARWFARPAKAEPGRVRITIYSPANGGIIMERLNGTYGQD